VQRNTEDAKTKKYVQVKGAAAFDGGNLWIRMRCMRVGLLCGCCVLFGGEGFAWLRCSRDG
jgi:hypothetical protein